MLDVCPTCRIQAPHRPERHLCPRCGGRLMVVDQYGHTVRTAAPPPPAARRPLRWVADRPAAARPEPRPRRPEHATSSTPSYRDIPRWGLVDAAPTAPAPDAQAADPVHELTRGLALTTYALGAAALAHLVRYLIAVINRTTPIPMWLDLLSAAAVLVFGICAFIGMVVALVVFVRWLLWTRAAAYAEAHRLDPRPRWAQLVLAATPLVNVVGAPLLAAEAALCRGTGAEAAGERIKRLAVAWGLVNLVALSAVGYRIGAWTGDSVQTSADALAVVTLSLAVSAVFTHWAAPRLATLFDGPDDRSRPTRRLVPA